MSNGKRKPKVIHVDKVIIKANKVIIVDEEKRNERKHDSWGFSKPVEREESSSESSSDESTDDKKGWSWM
jgi:hypothetical protein